MHTVGDFVLLPHQEVLQVHLDAELRGPQLQRRWQPSVPAQHHDGPEEVLQPPLPLPRSCCGATACRDVFLKSRAGGGGL